VVCILCDGDAFVSCCVLGYSADSQSFLVCLRVIFVSSFS
jgi:hypothetical protein